MSEFAGATTFTVPGHAGAHPIAPHGATCGHVHEPTAPAAMLAPRVHVTGTLLTYTEISPGAMAIVPVFLMETVATTTLSTLTDFDSVVVVVVSWLVVDCDEVVNKFWKNPNVKPTIAITISKSRIVAIIGDIPLLPFIGFT